MKRIFSGWMYAASPGLHGVEHPVYDIWLTDCKGPDQTIVSAQPDPPKAPPPPPAQKTPAAAEAGSTPSACRRRSRNSSSSRRHRRRPQQRPGGLFGGLSGNLNAKRFAEIMLCAPR